MSRIKLRILLIYWVIAAAFFMPTAVYAYIDPATTTYIIQIITAVIITLGVTLSIVLLKIKSGAANIRMAMISLKIRRARNEKDEAQNIRPNTSKNTSPRPDLKYPVPVRKTYPNIIKPGDLEKMKTKMPAFLRIEENSDEIKKAETDEQNKSDTGKWRFLWGDERNYLKRLRISLLVFGAVAFTFIIFGAIDLIQANAIMLPFRLSDIDSYIYLIALFVFIIPALILPLLRGRIFDLCLSAVFAFLVAGYVQGNFLNTGLGAMTGDPVAWNEITTKILGNTLIWFGILIFVFAIRYFSKKTWHTAIHIVPVAIIVIQLVALTSIFASGALQTALNVEDDSKDQFGLLTYKGLLEVSSDNNIIVIILDRMDDEYVEELKKEDSDFFVPMDGFTHYTNYISSYPTTFAAVPEFLTAKYCYWDIDQKTWFDEAWGQSTFLPNLKEQGFGVKLYTEKGQTYSDIYQLLDIADNTSLEKITLDKRLATKKILQLSVYRYAPFALKSTFWMPAHDFGQVFYSYDSEYTNYAFDDIYVYNQFVEKRLRISGNAGNFAFYHLQGPHEPLIYDENVQYSNETNLQKQMRGSFKIVFEFIEQLKELGVYENATIIVMGDHGWPNNTAQLIVEEPIIPGLFIKPAGLSGTPLMESNVPLGTSNLRATIVQAAGGDASEYGKPVQDVPENDQTPRKYFWKNGPSHPDLVGGPELLVYEVIGDGRDIKNWHAAEFYKDISYWYY